MCKKNVKSDIIHYVFNAICDLIISFVNCLLYFNKNISI
jgi:hypothetical protein